MFAERQKSLHFHVLLRSDSFLGNVRSKRLTLTFKSGEAGTDPSWIMKEYLKVKMIMKEKQIM